MVRTSSAGAVSGGTRSSMVPSRSGPAARSVAYQRVPPGHVGDGLGDGEVQVGQPAGPVPVDGRAEQGLAGAGGLEHVLAVHRAILADPGGGRHRADGPRP
jgi:hypothetical protein